MELSLLTPTPDASQRTVGELVAEDYRRAPVFKRFGIDFCCGGGKTLAAACAKAGVSVDEVAGALATAGTEGGVAPLRVEGWAPGFLADYIVNQHHTYVRDQIPALRAFTTKVARVHGAAHPELVAIARLFEEVAAELTEHMAAEEEAVFPRIKVLDEEHRAGYAPPRASGPPLAALLDVLEGEHDRAGELMREIRRLSADFTPPADACATYRATFVNLEAFEDDLHRHVHLENNVLFPKALALEAEAAA